LVEIGTQIYDDSAHPISTFIESHIPIDELLWDAKKRIDEWLPNPTTPASAKHATYVGKLFEYRLALLCHHQPFYLENAPTGIFQAFRQHNMSSVQDRNAEDEIIRLCAVLYRYHNNFTREPEPEHPSGPSYSECVEAMTSVPTPVIEDIYRLAQRFEERYPTRNTMHAAFWVQLPNNHGIFSLQADAIIDHMLIDVKTRRSNTVSRHDLRQIITYALLDWDDNYGIQSVGIYLSRLGLTVSWGLDELTERAGFSFSEMRQHVKDMLERDVWRRVATAAKEQNRERGQWHPVFLSRQWTPAHRNFKRYVPLYQCFDYRVASLLVCMLQPGVSNIAEWLSVSRQDITVDWELGTVQLSKQIIHLPWDILAFLDAFRDHCERFFPNRSCIWSPDTKPLTSLRLKNQLRAGMAKMQSPWYRGSAELLPYLEGLLSSISVLANN